jgi:hypothetical protein
MLEISTAKIAHVIVCAREYDAKTGNWEDALQSGFREERGGTVLQNFATEAAAAELAEFIANLNDDEQSSLVALAWLGRGSFPAEALDEAIAAAKAEKVSRTETYLMGIPLLADYLEEGLDRLGYPVGGIEKDNA